MMSSEEQNIEALHKSYGWTSSDERLPDMGFSNEHGKWSAFVLVMFHDDPAVCVLWQAHGKTEPRWVAHRTIMASIPVPNTVWTEIALPTPALLTSRNLEQF